MLYLLNTGAIDCLLVWEISPGELFTILMGEIGSLNLGDGSIGDGEADSVVAAIYTDYL